MLYRLQVGGNPLTTPITLGPTDTLKLSFAINEKGKDGKGAQPHQTFLRFFDEETGEEGIQPIRVSSGGKAKFELVRTFLVFLTWNIYTHVEARVMVLQNMARPPLSLPPSGDSPLRVSLLLGSFVHDPLQAHLFDLSVPASAPPPQHPEEVTFHPLPEIKHTFRPDPKSPPQIISAIFAGIVLAPWIVLLTFVSQHPISILCFIHLSLIMQEMLTN